MSFSPVIPMGGYGGWAFLQRTMDNQRAAFEKTPVLQKDDAYFREKIGSIATAEELVADRRLLKVTLGAFGLDADIDNKAFVRKVLEEGTFEPGALANRLSDKRYLELSKAFGFGDLPIPRSTMSDFPDKLLANYRTLQFEIAVGTQNGDMRIVMNAQRELPELAARTGSDTAKWYSILGSEPLRQIFQTAFGLPTAFGSIDIDQQVDVLKDKTASLFGDSSVSQFTDPEKMDTMIRRYLAISQLSGSGSSVPTSPALQILQGGTGILNILG